MQDLRINGRYISKDDAYDDITYRSKKRPGTNENEEDHKCSAQKSFLTCPAGGTLYRRDEKEGKS